MRTSISNLLHACYAQYLLRKVCEEPRNCVHFSSHLVVYHVQHKLRVVILQDQIQETESHLQSDEFVILIERRLIPPNKDRHTVVSKGKFQSTKFLQINKRGQYLEMLLSISYLIQALLVLHVVPLAVESQYLLQVVFVKLLCRPRPVSICLHHSLILQVQLHTKNDLIILRNLVAVSSFESVMPLQQHICDTLYKIRS